VQVNELSKLSKPICLKSDAYDEQTLYVQLNLFHPNIPVSEIYYLLESLSILSWTYIVMLWVKCLRLIAVAYTYD
jgi:hypothetical protein